MGEAEEHLTYVVPFRYHEAIVDEPETVKQPDVGHAGRCRGEFAREWVAFVSGLDLVQDGVFEFEPGADVPLLRVGQKRGHDGRSPGK